MLSRVVSHGPCPACRKLGRDRHGDNLATYDDGHTFCFACGYRSNYGHPSLRTMAKRLYQHSVLPHADALAGLGELTFDLPVKAQAWLSKYGITQLEQIQNGIQWSEDKQYLVLPITNEHGYVVGTNSRYFGDNPNHPKYVNNTSNAGIFKLVRPENSQVRCVVLVEDLLSAIKVGRHAAALCLTGTNLPDDLLLRILSYCNAHDSSVVVWLDSNMHQKAIGYAKRFSQFLPATAVVDVEGDPKDLNDLQIVDVLSRASQVLPAGQAQLGEVQPSNQQTVSQS